MLLCDRPGGLSAAMPAEVRCTQKVVVLSVCVSIRAAASRPEALRPDSSTTTKQNALPLVYLVWYTCNS